MFESLVGNNENKLILRDAIKNKTVVNSYMFVGKSGIGKKLFAKEFAKNILCLHGEECNNTCDSCIKFEANSNPDYIYVEENDKNIVSIDMIRELQQQIIQKPIVSKNKVCIINDAELMNEPAQNCFLKTLEEPPEYMTIILIVSNESKILPTIKSRCVILKFSDLSSEDIKKVNPNVSDNMLTVLNGSLENIENVDSKIQEYESITKIFNLMQTVTLPEVLNNSSLLYDGKSDIINILDMLNIVLFNNKIYEAVEIVEKTKTKIQSNNNYEMCIDYLLMNIYDIVRRK